MRRVNRNLYPTGGYVFEEADGTELRAGNWRGLFARIAKYRADNHLPPGNPEQDVQDQYCSKNPAGCWDTDNRMPRPGSQREQIKRSPTLKSRVLEWLAVVIKQKEAKKVTITKRELAAQRLVTCKGCPKKGKIGGGCAACSQAMKGLREKVLGFAPAGTDTGGCTVLGQDIATMCWLEEPTIVNGDLPDFCWKKRTI